jgi:hypothetical protein
VRLLLIVSLALAAAGCGHGPRSTRQAPAPVPLGARGRPIAPGETREGALTLSSPQFADSSRYQLFTFTARAGDTLTATLVSDDFDPFLVFADDHGNTLAKDDDAGGDCNARLLLAPATAGRYRLYVNSNSRAELGQFRLTVAAGAPTTPADSACRGFGSVAGMIQVGQTVTDSLGGENPIFSTDSTYFQRWILPARAGRTFTVDLSSSAFDAYLMLAHGRGERLAYNDDGGPGCDARVVYTPEDDRPLRIIVNTSSRPKHQTGAFTLRVSDGAAPVDSSHDCQGHADPTRVVRAGQRVEGRLTGSDMMFQSDSTYAQIWTLTGTAGDTVTIDLMSDAFDAYLLVSGPGLPKDLQDDDSGGYCNARVTLAFPQSGTYQVVANTADKLATGRYLLAVTAGTRPPPGAGDPGCERATQ